MSMSVHRGSPSRMRLIAPLLVGVIGIVTMLLFVAPLSGVSAQAAPISSSVVSTEELLAVPADRHWVIRQDHELNKEHSHSGGFMYVQKGAADLQIEGDTYTYREGEGVWIPEGVPHTHRAEAGTQILSVTLDTEAQAAAASTLLVSGNLATGGGGPHLARMTADQYAVGATTPLHRHFGPEVVFVRDGTYELASGGNTRQYTGGQGYTMEPQLPHRLRNAGQDVAHLFNISLVPLGRQTGETVSLNAPDYAGLLASR
jgi:quercetin dioxygenase-like cupin family protein